MILITGNEEENKVQCRLCFEEIKVGAKVCPHCERHQSMWLNVIQHLATFTALIMVLLGVAQLLEARKQRIEAESVLRQAQIIMTQTEDDSKRIIRKADIVLDDAKTNSKEAVAASQKALKTANVTLEYATKTNSDVKQKMDAALSYVKASVGDSNKRIKESEQRSNESLEYIKRDIAEVKAELSSELYILEERNKLTALGDKAIGDGDRKSFEGLLQISAKNAGKNIAVLSEILRVKGHYGAGSAISGNPEITKNGVLLKNEEIKTDELIELLLLDSDWHIRGAAARLLGGRSEKKVPDTLIEAMKKEVNLDVLHLCIRSFAQLTGYKMTDTFRYDPPLLTWWSKNKANVLQKLK